MNRNTLFYLLVVIVFGIIIWGLFELGYYSHTISESGSTAVDNISTEVTDNQTSQNFIENYLQVFLKNLHHPLAILILQVIVIIFAARLFGSIFSKLNIPTVIGEILAGIVLGSSVLGLYLPEVSKFIFPISSLPNLHILSQLGLIFFMFIIGMELDMDVIKKRAHKALIISHTSILTSFSLGLIMAYLLYDEFSLKSVPFIHFGLFMGVSMSIAAFPVLARIAQERDMLKSSFGSMILTTAAIDDLTAWCLLAAAVAIVQAGTVGGAIFTIILSIGFISFMLFVVRPFFARLGSIYISEEVLNKTVVAFIMLIIFISSFITEVLGIHALFGAFMAGSIMPSNTNFKRLITEKIEDISLVVLLPLFFVFTGLRTQIGLLDNPHVWMLTAVLIIIAIVGKIGGSTAAGRFVGLTWKESLTLGTLLNTRGLIQLIVLNIGYDLGVFSSEIFVMLVIVALFTTFMTGPTLDLIEFIFKKRVAPEAKPATAVFRLLLSFGLPKMGSTLLKVARQIKDDSFTDAEITAMHLTPDSGIQPNEAAIFQSQSFAPIKKSAEEMGLKIQTRYKATDEVQREIIRTANKENFDFLLLGSAKSPFTEDKLGGKIRMLLENTECDVGVFIDNNFSKAENVLIILNGKRDLFIKKYLNSFVDSSKITVLSNSYADFKSEIFFEKDKHVNIHNVNEMRSFNLKNYDLLISSLYCWQALDDELLENIEKEISVLIIKGKDE
ncbi:MAG: cation:proton antiporter [Ignavibacteriales bacterium]|nr:MAG: cation:proton antiporter [Ignavibacteriales bacterium]